MGMYRLREGEPCSHPGCLNHKSHPCEGCGRTAGILKRKHEWRAATRNDKYISIADGKSIEDYSVCTHCSVATDDIHHKDIDEYKCESMYD